MAVPFLCPHMSSIATPGKPQPEDKSSVYPRLFSLPAYIADSARCVIYADAHIYLQVHADKALNGLPIAKIEIAVLVTRIVVFR